MGISRVLLLIIIVGFIWVLVRRYKNKKSAGENIQSKSSDISNTKKCKVCGIHVPEQEAIKFDGNYYCSKAHLNEDES